MTAHASTYAAELCRLKCSSRLLPLFQGCADPLKEVSESFGAYHAVERHLGWKFTDPGVTVICVGDGRTPRTGATFALRSAWTVYSVDPQMKRPGHYERLFRRLKCYPRRVEEVKIEADRAVIVAVHSHASLPAAVASVRARELAVVAMPCCVPQDLWRYPDVEYEDAEVLSPRRTVRVWRDVAS